jgi:hypothetical protein
MNPPKYFDEIATGTQKLWEQLDDPVLAGPWKQLFKQVQSPRHVLSELLQNADDARAKSASVRIQNGEFIFEHDGEDFSKDQFQSLCRFGFSNKRNLHTIGFRGVGFKSTFSLGKSVRVQTPSLDVVFEHGRFTLPLWSRNATSTPVTRISVPIADKRQLAQLRMNFEEWATSPASLLFFRHLRELKLESLTIRMEIMSRGPTRGSSRVRLVGANTQELLLFTSSEEAFPEDVLDEIRQERNADDLNLPPCCVDLVLGLDGEQELFTVLPAGTGVELPFSVNAPFLQDPARQRIKEPEISPCNRWLLQRAGKLAGEAMVGWLANEQLSEAKRAGGYGLLPARVVDAADLRTGATKEVVDSFLTQIAGEAFLLTTEGKVKEIGKCTELPVALHGVWDLKELIGIFADTSKDLLSPEIPHQACELLQTHGWVETVSSEKALQTLTLMPAIPKPASWSRLKLLWDWVETKAGWDYTGERRRALRIVPVEGQALLQPGRDVIRVSSRGQQLSDEDWNFISNFALAVDREWVAHLGKLKSKDDDEHPALGLLQTIGLHEPTQVDRIAAQASRRLLARGKMPIADCVRIAQIFAALDAAVPDDFRYVTEDLQLRLIKDISIVFDDAGAVEALVPKAWSAEHLLHPEYTQSFTSCSRDRWLAWAYSAKSKLLASVPLGHEEKRFYRRTELEAFVITRGGAGPSEYRYKNDCFIVDDFDFPAELVKHWEGKAQRDPAIWAAVCDAILSDPLESWKSAFRVSIRQRSAQGSTSLLDCKTLEPGWLPRLRSKACLKDTHGKIRMPAELLLRTPDTETLLGLEPFVAAELDSSPAQKLLLRFLGVQNTATEWGNIVERLRQVVRLKEPVRFLANVLRLYEALDRISLRCSAEELSKLRAVFASEPLILSDAVDWLSAGELSLHADPDDDSPVVHSAAHALALWLRVGVPERPVLEKTLEWLKTLAAGTRLDGTSYSRASRALARGGRRVWDELGHWLSLDQSWEPTSGLRYRVSMRNLTRWEKLTASTKRSTADLRMLHGEAAEEAPFTVVRPLAEVISMQVTNAPPVSGRRWGVEWLEPLAEGLSQVKLADESATTKVRSVARRLLNTTSQSVSLLEATPYIDGTPAGEPLMPKVLWSETKLYLVDQPTARLYRELKDELGRPFAESSVAEAVAHCIDRTAEFVREYLAANFEIDAQAELAVDAGKNESGGEAWESTDSPKGHEDGEEEQSEDADADVEPEPAGEGGYESEAEEEEKEKEGKAPTPKEPTFMDRYARARGFRWHEEERCYTHANGAWIEKAEAPFNWQEHVNGDDAARRLFVVEESLVRGVEIPYELWRLMEINPDSIALVLCGEEGAPHEFGASRLQQLKAAGQIVLHQSRFILREQSTQ